VLLGAPLPKLTRLRPAERRAMSHVAAHIAAGYRLRRAFERRPLSVDDDRVAAVLSASGDIQHATAEAKPALHRQRLREQAFAIDHARSKRCADPHEALALWKALIAGRWSLVDRFDSDGRRYFVAIKNDPDVTHPRALTPRERQVAGFAALGLQNKLIAYELDISSAAVSLHLRSALVKLGLAGRAELAARFPLRVAACAAEAK